ncbi:hypothetical protein OS493_026145 [Desmophyllum pertusum]|uniref:Uncharacterized protein n=1 Tax=Desmophyllum pertusum TaxID=174260 RepID=A0A9X0D824_9CNID|nr:hypothetical protein OS493_026145 [Desmophyllum pertusum]
MLCTMASGTVETLERVGSSCNQQDGGLERFQGENENETNRQSKREEEGYGWCMESDNDTLVVQRLSTEMSGKAQKYSRIGAREFVSYEYEEFTIENIRNACQKHFSVDETMTCDVVAGEQGPSCSSVKQIPDSKVIHVRLVERVAIGEPDEGIEVTRVDGPAVKSPPAKRRFSGVENGTQNRSQPTKSAPSPSKFVPRSLSVVEMLKLGKAITQSTTSVSIYSFDLKQMSWSRIPSTIDFSIQKEPFGTGGFREAYKATSNAKGFENITNCFWASLTLMSMLQWKSFLKGPLSSTSTMMGAFVGTLAILSVIRLKP